MTSRASAAFSQPVLKPLTGTWLFAPPPSPPSNRLRHTYTTVLVASSINISNTYVFCTKIVAFVIYLHVYVAFVIYLHWICVSSNSKRLQLNKIKCKFNTVSIVRRPLLTYAYLHFKGISLANTCPARMLRYDWLFEVPRTLIPHFAWQCCQS